MPGLVVYGRRWRVASDDFVIPSLGLAVLRTLWLTVLISYASYVVPNLHGCRSGGPIIALLVVLMLLDVGLIALEVRLMLTSRRGSILNTPMRKTVPRLLYWLSALSIFEASGSILGTWLAYGRGASQVCVAELEAAPGGRQMFRVAMVAELCLVASVVISVYVFFDRQGSEYIRNEAREVLRPSGSRSSLELPLFNRDFTREKRIWEGRCRFICCTCRVLTCKCFSSQSNSVHAESPSFITFARLVHQLLGALDLTVSDVAAGVLLLRAKQRASTKLRLIEYLKVQQANGEDVGDELAHLTEDPRDKRRGRKRPRRRHLYQIGEGYVVADVRRDGDILRDVAYYVRYAVGVYGFVFQAYVGVCSAAPLIVPGAMRGHCCRPQKAHVSVAGDNYCGTNFENFLQGTGLEPEDVLHASFVSVDNYMIPFMVVKDDEKRMIIVICRGSMSAEDALTDVTAVSESINDYTSEFPIAPDKNHFLHGGILRVAVTIRRDLDIVNVIDPALKGRCAGYGLLVTGHSLGAGVGATLALLLKPKYPDLRCFAYACPGGLMNKELAATMDDYCVSVVIGEDVIARLSIPSFFRTRDLMIEAIAHSQANKSVIYQSAFSPYPELDGLFAAPNESYYQAAEAAVENFMSFVRADDERRTRNFESFMPGRILHYAVTHVDLKSGICPGTRRRKRAFGAFWAPREAFIEVVMSHRMFFDHVPDYYAKVICDYLPEHQSTESVLFGTGESKGDNQT